MFIRLLTGVLLLTLSPCIAKTYIETERLRLRDWKQTDFEPLYAIHQDSDVIAHLPRDRYTKATIQDKIKTMNQHIAAHGFGSYACVLKDTGELMGLVGVNVVD